MINVALFAVSLLGSRNVVPSRTDAVPRPRAQIRVQGRVDGENALLALAVHRGKEPPEVQRWTKFARWPGTGLTGRIHGGRGAQSGLSARDVGVVSPLAPRPRVRPIAGENRFQLATGI